jgi:hypothetical protein
LSKAIITEFASFQAQLLIENLHFSAFAFMGHSNNKRHSKGGGGVLQSFTKTFFDSYDTSCYVLGSKTYCHSEI